MAYGLINADVIGTSVAGSNIGAGNASIMKNRIINGAMVIDQRNAGASQSPSGNTFIVDRFALAQDAASKFTCQQNAGSVTPPSGFINYAGVTSTSAYSPTSGQVFGIFQNIEGFNCADLNFGTANAQTITLSFWVRSSLTGTFGGALQNGAGNRSYPFTYSISSANTWEQKSVTIAGDTTGTWNANNLTGISLFFSLGAGSSRSSTANSWQAGAFNSATGATSVVGTNGATFYLTGVQLEVGSSATGFEYVNYQTSLANCQRYTYIISSTGTGSASSNIGTAANSTVGRFIFQNPVTMRTAPSYTLSGSIGNFGLSDGATGGYILTSASLVGSGPNFVTMNLGTSSLNQYRPYVMEVQGSGTTFIFSAEL